VQGYLAGGGRWRQLNVKGPDGNAQCRHDEYRDTCHQLQARFNSIETHPPGKEYDISNESSDRWLCTSIHIKKRPSTRNTMHVLPTPLGGFSGSQPPPRMFFVRRISQSHRCTSKKVSQKVQFGRVQSRVQLNKQCNCAQMGKKRR